MAGTWVAYSSAGGITTLTSDVTATGTGSVAATVASVGGSTAANVHTAELAANAAVITPAASTIPKWDANKNLSGNNFITTLATTVTAAGTTALTVASAGRQQFTGTTTQTVTLPDATTLVLWQSWLIINRSTASVTVNNASAGLVLVVTPGNSVLFTVTAIGTAAGTWDAGGSAYSDANLRAGLAADGNTSILYKFEDSGATSADSSGNAVNLTANGSPVSSCGPGGLNALARTLTTTSGFVTTGAIGQTNNTLLASGAFTTEFWFRPYDDTPANSMIAYCKGVNATTDINDMVLLYIAYDTTNQRLQLAQYSNATTVVIVNVGVANSIPLNKWTKVSLTRTATSGGNVTFACLLNDIPVTTISNATCLAPTAAAPTGAHYLYIGGYLASGAGGAADTARPHVDIKDFRLSNIIRTNAVCITGYLAGRP